MMITNEEHKKQCEVYTQYLNDQTAEMVLGKLRDMWYTKETTVVYPEKFNKDDYQDIIQYARKELVHKMREKCWFCKDDETELQVLTFQWHAHLYKFKAKIEEFAKDMQEHVTSFSCPSPQDSVDLRKEWDDLRARGLIDDEGYELTEEGERIIRYKGDKKYTQPQWDAFIAERYESQ